MTQLRLKSLGRAPLYKRGRNAFPQEWLRGLFHHETEHEVRRPAKTLREVHGPLLKSIQTITGKRAPDAEMVKRALAGAKRTVGLSTPRQWTSAGVPKLSDRHDEGRSSTRLPPAGIWW